MAHPPLFSFVFIVVGALWLSLWQQPWRKWGIFPICLGFLTAFWGDPPHLLIDGRGKLVALYDNNILHLNSLRKGKFVADVWKKHLAAQEIKPLACKEGVCEAVFQDIPIVISSVKENQPCVKGAILIRLEPSQKACPDAYHTLDWYDLWRGGSHALWLTLHGLRLEKVRPSRHHRPWQHRPISRKHMAI